MINTNDIFLKKLLSLNTTQKFREINILNPVTARMILSSNPSQLSGLLKNIELISKLAGKPYKNPDSSANGPIVLAVSENRHVIGLYPDECHCLIVGQTGSGKSTLLKIIFSQALVFNRLNPQFEAMENIICWLFCKAQDMRNLLKINKNVLIVTFKMIKLNPLEPPSNLSTTEWSSIFADLWTQAFRLYDGSKGLLIDCLNYLYNKYSSTDFYPSLFDLYYYVRALKFPLISRSSRYQESILNRLGGLIHSPLGSVFDCSRGHISNLINLHTIFEITFLTAEQQVFMVNYLLSYLFYHKLIRETGLRHFVGIDDANLIFDISFEKRPDLGLPIIHHLLTTVRKSKINIFACTQTPHQIGASIHSNSFAKVMFSLSHGKDIDCMQQSMGIKDPMQRDYCYKLMPREAVFKFSARHQEPFLAKVQEVNL